MMGDKILVEEFEDDELGNPLMSKPSLIQQLFPHSQNEWTPNGLPSVDESGNLSDSLGSIKQMGVLERSHKGKTPLQKKKPVLLTILRSLLAANTQVSILIILFCCTFAYISSRSKKLNEHDDNWQMCYVRVGRFKEQTNLNFPGAAAAYGIQVVVYSNVAIGIAIHSLHHTALLPAIIPMVAYDMLCILSYFSLQHILPFPTELEATLVSLTKYIHPGMYNSLNLGDTCDNAFRFALAFVLLAYIALVIVFAVFVIIIYANQLRKKALPAARVEVLAHTRWPNRLAFLVFCGYVVQLVGKAKVSLLAIKTFQASLDPTYYPAATTSLDPTTIFLVVANMAVIRGTLARSSSAFRLGAGSAVMYLATTWSSMVSTVTLFETYDLFTHHGCMTFFKGQLAWGFPDTNDAMSFCTASRISFIGEILVFIAMNLQVVACVMCFMGNRKRSLGLFNTAPPENAQTLLHGGLGHTHSAEPASGGTGLKRGKLYPDSLATGFE